MDGIVVDWAVSEVGGIDFLEQIQARLTPFVPPLIVFGPRYLDAERAANLHRLSRFSAVRYAPSLERLLDETVLLLHRSEDSFAASQKEILAQVRQADPVLAGRKILVVDDDLRNIFALTSVLEEHDITVLHAENGRGGIEISGGGARHRHGADGHHDAGDGRVRNHPGDPEAFRAWLRCRSSLLQRKR